jgi:hypothetical protein
MNKTNKPTNGAIIERALSLCNEMMFTVALQHRRIKSVEPEDQVFLFRQWADFQFLVIALKRLRRSAEIKINGEIIGNIKSALIEFDNALPSLTKMRNVIEHIDEYGLDKGRDESVKRHALQVGSNTDTVFFWLDEKINIDDALHAAEKLLLSVRQSVQDLQIRD